MAGIPRGFMVMHQKNRKPEAVVLGNGPSLRGFDFCRLARFDVFGMNAAYRYWYEIGWFPQYYSCLDLVVGPSHRDAIVALINNSDRLGIRGFLLRQSLIEELATVAACPTVYNFDALRSSFESWIPGPVTTGSHTCAWASILGYKDIYLLGVDCNYVEIVPNAERRNGTVLEITSDAPNPNYFFYSYQKKGDQYNIPNPRKDLHLQGWRTVSAKLCDKSRVLNANFASRVDAFSFVRFEDVERGGWVPIFSPSAVIGGGPLGEPVDHVLVPSGANTKPPPTAFSRSAATQPELEDVGHGLKLLRSILVYDAEWQHPADTEQHAFAQAVKLLPETPGVVYFGFPWAALIEQMNANMPASGRLQEALESARLLSREKKQVITVCQHPDLLKYQRIIASAGITHVFWPHAVLGQDCFPEYKDIKILPFPFFPAGAADSAQPVARKLTDKSAFFLCVSGPCRNSAQLWEAVGNGLIPVVSSSALLPGSKALWDEATVSCPERREDIETLNGRLEALARDEGLIERKRHALRQFWMLYGPGCFIYDIQKLFLSLAAENVGTELPGTSFSYGRLFSLAGEISRTRAGDPSLTAVFALGCTSRVLSDPAGFLARYRETELFRKACLQVLSSRANKYSEAMRKAFELRGVPLGPEQT
jgi:hypothetical protein